MRDELAEELELDQSALTAALLNQLFIALGEQQPLLSLEQLAAVTPAASIEGQARLVPDLSAARSATGAGHFVIRGLDRFTNEIVNADIANKETILAVIATLGVLGAETIENGVTTHGQLKPWSRSMVSNSEPTVDLSSMARICRCSWVAEVMSRTI